MLPKSGVFMTLAEIAAHANVSTGTVDRVLHGRKGVSEKTKKLIQQIIDEYGYQPNPIASQLKNNKIFVIGVLLLAQVKDAHIQKAYSFLFYTDNPETKKIGSGVYSYYGSFVHFSALLTMREVSQFCRILYMV